MTDHANLFNLKELYMERYKDMTFDQLRALHRAVGKRYRNPDNTWAGRDNKPSWRIEALDDGRSLDEFEVAE